MPKNVSTHITCTKTYTVIIQCYADNLNSITIQPKQMKLDGLSQQTVKFKFKLSNAYT